MNTKARTRNATLSNHELRHDAWIKVLLIPGRSEVTRESDRLVAIAGIAMKFSSISEDERIAGLRRKLLPGMLLRYMDRTRHSNKPPPDVNDHQGMLNLEVQRLGEEKAGKESVSGHNKRRLVCRGILRGAQCGVCDGTDLQDEHKSQA